MSKIKSGLKKLGLWTGALTLVALCLVLSYWNVTLRANDEVQKAEFQIEQLKGELEVKQAQIELLTRQGDNLAKNPTLAQ